MAFVASICWQKKKERLLIYVRTYMLCIYAHTGNSSRVLLLLIINIETAYYTW